MSTRLGQLGKKALITERLGRACCSVEEGERLAGFLVVRGERDAIHGNRSM